MDVNPTITLADPSTHEIPIQASQPAPAAAIEPSISAAAAAAVARRREWIVKQLADLRNSYSACSRGYFAVQTSLLEEELRKLSPDA
jgi:hypothetical protein